MGYTKEAIKGISWIGLIRVVIRILIVVKTSLIARILTPSQFGLFGLVSIVFALIDIFTETGINIFLVQRKEDIDKYINTAWLVSIARGMVMAAVLVVSSPVVSQFFGSAELILLLLTVSIVPFIKGFINPSIVKFQKELMFSREFSFRTSIFFVESLFSVLFVFLTHSPIGLVLGMIVSAIFEVLISFQVIKPRPSFEFVPHRFKQILREGKWVTISGVFSYLYQHGDDAAVGKMLGTSPLGLYDMAYRISLAPITDIGETVARVTFPVYVKISDDVARLKKAFAKSLFSLLLLVLPASFVLYFFPREIISILLGSQWLEAASILRILAIFSFIRSFSVISSAVFLSLHKQNIVTLVSFMGFLGLALTIVPFINFWGVDGAALSALFGAAISLPITFYYLYTIFYKVNEK